METLFLFNNAHNGDIVFSRPLYKMIIASGRFEVLLGGACNTAYLMEDLVGPRSRLLVSDYADVGQGVVIDLVHMAPPGSHAVHTWLGEYVDTHMHQWFNVVEVFNRKMIESGLDFAIEFDQRNVPMVDFHTRPLGSTVHGRAIYVDNSFARGHHSNFLFDVDRLSREFPEHWLLCTARPEVRRSNVIDCSGYDLIALSHLSDHCEAILGKGSGPFCCTYTETNRFKPRAVCGYHSETSPTFWDYPGNPLQYLTSMDEVVAFLHASVSIPVSDLIASCQSC